MSWLQIILSPRLSTGTRTVPLSQLLYFNSLMVATYVPRIYVFIDIRMSGVMFLTCVSGVRMSGVVFLSNYYIIIYNDIW